MAKLVRQESPLGGKLDEYLWIHSWQRNYVRAFASMREELVDIEISGNVKPIGVQPEDSDVVVRHKLLLAYECALAEIKKQGYEHKSFPDLQFTGTVLNHLGGPQSLVVEAKFDFILYPRRTQ